MIILTLTGWYYYPSHKHGRLYEKGIVVETEDGFNDSRTYENIEYLKETGKI